MFSYKHVQQKGDIKIEKDIKDGKIIIQKQKIE
jgi:hypothetical protein